MNKDKDDLKESNNINSHELPPIFVGQVLYREITYRNSPSEIKEVTVGRIGRKYFYLLGFEYSRCPVNLNTLQYIDDNYSQFDFKLYRTVQEILDKNEMLQLMKKIKEYFSWSANVTKVTLNQLREIANVLGISNKQF